MACERRIFELQRFARAMQFFRPLWRARTQRLTATSHVASDALRGGRSQRLEHSRRQPRPGEPRTTPCCRPRRLSSAGPVTCARASVLGTTTTSQLGRKAVCFLTAMSLVSERPLAAVPCDFANVCPVLGHEWLFGVATVRAPPRLLSVSKLLPVCSPFLACF